MHISNNKGMTIIEIIIIIAIIAVISSIVLWNLSSFRNEQALKNTTSDVISILNEARENTISSLNSTNYSVHFEADRAVLFIGATYSASLPTNEVTIFSPNVIIPATGGINISGGGSDITFKRLTGEVINGTIDSSIVIQLVSDATKQKTITINKTGVISSN
ncbi:MAG: prepilin-type N-terminal cleavage/methylation domain-containing protein [Candidatus Paceibacterota bacterium]|jgi:type II secretory pathway pseudopilin PulG